MAELGMGTLYDFNIAAMENEPRLNKKAIKEKIEELTDYFSSVNNNYYLLLCNEEKYYTLFHFFKKEKNECIQSAKDVIECMQNYGILLSISKVDNTSYEIWARNKEDKTIHCFYLFPYDMGVIEYGKE
jgi:hypothetical protein